MFWRNHWKSVVLALLIFTLSVMPADRVPRVGFLKIPHADKLVHCFLYFVFGTLLISGFNRLKVQRGVTNLALLWAAAISIPYGMGMELIQHFFTSRSASWFDVVANIMGFLVAALLYRIINRSTKGYI